AGIVDRLWRQLKLTGRIVDVLLVRHQPEAEGVLSLAGVALVDHPLAELCEAAGVLPGHVGLAVPGLALLAGDCDGPGEAAKVVLLEAKQQLLRHRLGGAGCARGERPEHAQQSEAQDLSHEALPREGEGQTPGGVAPSSSPSRARLSRK